MKPTSDPAYLPGSIIRGPSFSDPKRIVTGLVLGQHTDGLDEWWVDTIDRDEKPSNMVLLTQPIEVLRFAGEIRRYLDGGPLAHRSETATRHIKSGLERTPKNVAWVAMAEMAIAALNDAGPLSGDDYFVDSASMQNFFDARNAYTQAEADALTGSEGHG